MRVRVMDLACRIRVLASTVRRPAHVVLVGDVRHARDGDGLARLVDDEIWGVRRREVPVARSFEGRVTGGHREHATRRRVVDHEVVLIVEREQPADPVQDPTTALPAIVRDMRYPVAGSMRSIQSVSVP